MRRFLLIMLLLFLGFLGSIVVLFALATGQPLPKLPSFAPSSPLPTPLALPVNGVQIGAAPSFRTTLPPGFATGIFAKSLGNPRDLLMSDGGTLLASIPSQNKVVALPDVDQNGIADRIVEIATNLNNPHGIGFYQDKLFIVEETQVVRYTWDENTLTATPEKVLFALPRGGNHTTRSIAFNKTGQMFISIGSTCNVCLEKHEWLAAVIVSDSEGNNPQRFAKGLRNAPFITVHPTTNQLWGTEMGRDNLGDFTPPDEINIIESNRDYGWPFCWGEKVHDTVFDKNQYIRDPCANTEKPLFGIGAHSAPLGLIFIDSPQFPADWQGDLLVAYHGSWNRTSPIGYKVVHLDLNGNDIVAEEDFFTGFLNGERVNGRPVDFAFDPMGSLYISDDRTGVIYKVISSQ